MFKVEYYDPLDHPYSGRYPFKSEEIIGFFETIEDFKNAALERWASKRDQVVFTDETENGLKAHWEYLGMRSRPSLVVSRVQLGWTMHDASV